MGHKTWFRGAEGFGVCKSRSKGVFVCIVGVITRGYKGVLPYLLFSLSASGGATYAHCGSCYSYLFPQPAFSGGASQNFLTHPITLPRISGNSRAEMTISSMAEFSGCSTK